MDFKELYQSLKNVSSSALKVGAVAALGSCTPQLYPVTPELNLAYVDANMDGVVDLYLIDKKEIFVGRENHFDWDKGLTMHPNYLAKQKQAHYELRDGVYHFDDMALMPLGDEKYALAIKIIDSNGVEKMSFFGSNPTSIEDTLNTKN